MPIYGGGLISINTTGKVHTFTLSSVRVGPINFSLSQLPSYSPFFPQIELRWTQLTPISFPPCSPSAVASFCPSPPSTALPLLHSLTITLQFTQSSPHSHWIILGFSTGPLSCLFSYSPPPLSCCFSSW